jgi:hypothetical protein
MSKPAYHQLNYADANRIYVLQHQKVGHVLFVYVIVLNFVKTPKVRLRT